MPALKSQGLFHWADRNLITREVELKEAACNSFRKYLLNYN
jgi:hypothetical protein